MTLYDPAALSEIAPASAVAPVSAGTNFCPSCGAPAAGVGAFCTQCGGSLMAPAPVPVSTMFAIACSACGGEGRSLPASQVFCPQCRWLRPLVEGYSLPVGAYLWALDAQAMGVLSGIGPLNAAARALSARFSRPWFEASVSGVRLGPDQLPDVFEIGIKAARALGLPRMPELYISGEQMWEAMTLGAANDAFITLGSVLTNFKEDDLLFVLAREMGHAAAGHGLWRAVVQFVSGKHAARSMMADGVLKYLNPAKLVESAVDVPLMAWMRHAEITADRAGMLAMGKEDVGRRVLVQWTIRSFPLYARLNPAALERQLADAGTQTAQAAEWATTATPFIGPRLRLMHDFLASESFGAQHAYIRHWAEEVPRLEAEARRRTEAEDKQRAQDQAKPVADTVRLNCAACKEPMRVPRASLEQGGEIKVRCPNPKCQAVMTIKARTPPPVPTPVPAELAS